MTIQPDIDTDFSQFQDAMTQKRRASDHGVVAECSEEDCPAIFVLERRVDRHREEINELKKLMEKQSQDIGVVLEIISTAKGFFKAVGWMADQAKPLVMLGGLFAGLVTGVVLWLKQGGAKP